MHSLVPDPDTNNELTMPKCSLRGWGGKMALKLGHLLQFSSSYCSSKYQGSNNLTGMHSPELSNYTMCHDTFANATLDLMREMKV